MWRTGKGWGLWALITGVLLAWAPLHADWTFVGGGYINGVCMQGDHIWTAESDGRVRHSADGGETWESLLVPAAVRLYGVYFVDANTGWAVGNDGTIFHTTDGGQTWEWQTSGISNDLKGVYFVDANRGWAWGRSGKILYTEDGGATWTQQNSGITNTLYWGCFLNDTVGYVGGSSGKILKTTDGGQTWVLINSPTTSSLYSGWFVNDTVGWVVRSSGGIYKTTDGGNTWTQQNSNTTNTLYGVYATDENHAWAVGKYGTVLYTTDGGATWNAQTNLSPNYFEKIVMAPDNLTGVLVGWGGAIYKTTDGGQTWTPKAQETCMGFRRVAFGDADNVWAVGINGSIFHSGDGGLTWERQNAPVSSFMMGVDFLDGLMGWAVGYDGAVVYTADGGNTWTLVNAGTTEDLNDVEVVTSQVVYIVGQNGFAAMTVNGGTSWMTLSTGTTNDIKSVAFYNANVGIAVGEDGLVLRTYTGGLLWEDVSGATANTLYDVAYRDSLHVFAVGVDGTLLYSEDAGATWTSLSSGTSLDLYRISFASATEGWIAGGGTDASVLLHTTDGGQTWETVDLHSDLAVWGIDVIQLDRGDYLGVAASNGGAIYRYSTLPTWPELTIAEIQGMADHSPYEGDTVITYGIVTGAYSHGFFMEERPGGAWHGIWVYTSDPPGVAVGDSVKVIGPVQEYYDLTEISHPVSVEVLASGLTPPGPTVLPTGEVPQEQYEGVFVRVENATCTNPDLGYGEWEVDDGSGPVRVDDKGVAFLPDSGQRYNVQGGLFYSYGNYKIEPRDSSDIEEVGGPIVLFFDDFESGLDNWTGDWGLQEGTAHSPTHSYTDSPNSNYPDMSTLIGAMASGVDLTGYAGAFLYFWYKHWLEQGFDYCYLDVSVDGGNSWITLKSYNDTVDTWTHDTVDLSAFVGNADVRIRFRLVTDPAYNEDGMYVDDVMIVASTEDITPPLILHTPPADTQSIVAAYTAMAVILDYSDLAYDSLYYRFDGGTWTGLTPETVSGDTYYFVIPATPTLGVPVDYYFVAEDIQGNRAVSDTFRYITGYVLYYDDGDPDYITNIIPGQDMAVRFETNFSGADTAPQVLWLMYNFYRDTQHPLDTVDIYVWYEGSDQLPGDEAFGPRAVWPANTPTTPHAWTYVDLRQDSVIPVLPAGQRIPVTFFGGVHYRSAYPTILLDSPTQFNHSVTRVPGGNWTLVDADYFIRAIVAPVHYTAVAEGQQNLPRVFALGKASPNPFRGHTTLRFALPKATKVTLEIYDHTGRRVRTLVNTELAAGYHTATWNGTDDHGRKLSSGLYFYRMVTPEYHAVRKVLLVR